MTSTIETDNIEQLRFPIGMFEFGKQYTDEEIQAFIKKIDEFPTRLNKLVSGLSNEQLETTYRENGWTLRQCGCAVRGFCYNAAITCVTEFHSCWLCS